MPVLYPTETVAWPAAYPRHIAGVSAFGLTGVIAHVLLEAAPDLPPQPVKAGPFVLPLAARSAAELTDLTDRYRDHLVRHPEAQAADICFTAAVGRSHFTFRRAVVADDRDALLAELARPQAASASRKSPQIAFLFTGQGSQYAGMASGLAAREPVFRAVLERCDRLFARIAPAGPSLLSVLFSPEHAARIDETEYAQPALFALHVALAELWRRFGIAPVAVLGHSIGEIAAATIAGALSIEDGLRFAAHRGRLMQSLPRDGAMAAIFADAADVSRAIAETGGRVSIAAFNGPRETVISGARDVVAAIVARFTAVHTRCRELVTSHAFHSPLMDPIRAARAGGARPRVECAQDRRHLDALRRAGHHGPAEKPSLLARPGAGAGAVCPGDAKLGKPRGRLLHRDRPAADADRARTPLRGGSGHPDVAAVAAARS